jgi:hypothetical protein
MRGVALCEGVRAANLTQEDCYSDSAAIKHLEVFGTGNTLLIVGYLF